MNKNNIDFSKSYEITTQIHNRKIILTNIFYLLQYIHNFISELKDVSIISIGDSPAIFMQIYQKYIPSIKKKMFFLPISAINNKNKNLLSKKLEKIEQNIKTNKILWIDYLSSGKSLITIMNAVSKTKMHNKSNYVGYGYDIINNPLFDKVKNNKNIRCYKVDDTSLFFTFLASYIGNSEAYQIRCISRKIVNKNYIPELVNINSLPNNKTTSKYCKEYANFLYEEMINIHLILKE